MKKINNSQFEIKEFPDGSIYAKLLVKPELLYRTLTHRINSYRDFWDLECIKDIYDKHSIPVELTIPCLFEQQADRRFSDNESFGLRLVIKHLNNLNFKKVTIFHPHNPSIELALNNCVIKENTNFIEEVLQRLDNPNLVILSPDAGSLKWVYKLADKLDFQGEVVCAGKVRDHETHKLTQYLDKQDFDGRDVIIIDDMSLYGGTFLGLAALLKTRNIGKLYLAVYHITVESPNKALEEVFDTVFTINSKYDSYNLSNVEIIKLF